MGESDLLDPLCQGRPAELIERGAERAQEAAEAAASCSANQPQPHPWLEGGFHQKNIFLYLSPGFDAAIQHGVNPV